MEHRDKNMIIKAYSKYVENVTGSLDGLNFDAICQGIMVSKKGGQVKKFMEKLWQKRLQDTKKELTMPANPLIWLVGRRGIEPLTY